MLGATLHRLIFSRLTRGESVLLRCSLTSSACHCCHTANEQLLAFQLKPEPFDIIMCVWVAGGLLCLLNYCSPVHTLHLAFYLIIGSCFIFHERNQGTFSPSLSWQTPLILIIIFILSQTLIHQQKQVCLSCKQTGVQMIVLVIWCTISSGQSNMSFWLLARNSRTYQPHVQWL